MTTATTIATPSINSDAEDKEWLHETFFDTDWSDNYYGEEDDEVMADDLTYVVSCQQGDDDQVIGCFPDKDEALRFYHQAVKEAEPEDDSYDLTVYQDYEGECDYIDTIEQVELNK